MTTNICVLLKVPREYDRDHDDDYINNNNNNNNNTNNLPPSRQADPPSIKTRQKIGEAELQLFVTRYVRKNTINFLAIAE
jgi:hypothetical protein